MTGWVGVPKPLALLKRNPRATRRGNHGWQREGGRGTSRPKRAESNLAGTVGLFVPGSQTPP